MCIGVTGGTAESFSWWTGLRHRIITVLNVLDNKPRPVRPLQLTSGEFDMCLSSLRRAFVKAPIARAHTADTLLLVSATQPIRASTWSQTMSECHVRSGIVQSRGSGTPTMTWAPGQLLLIIEIRSTGMLMTAFGSRYTWSLFNSTWGHSGLVVV